MVIFVLVAFSLHASFLPPVAGDPGPSFNFYIGGDTGFGGSGFSTVAFSTASDDLVQDNFFLVLGDISYNGTSAGHGGTGNEALWCNFVKAHIHDRLGEPNYPYELVTGNHENTGAVDGFIGNTTIPGFKSCLPNQFTIHFANDVAPFGLTGGISGACATAAQCYGIEYYFDYPQSNPIARFIGIA